MTAEYDPKNDPMLHKIWHQKDIIDALMKENTKLRAALLLIAEHKLPYSGFSIDYGSNGIRDHFIGVASRALG